MWKILIFDQLGQDVISSVLRINDLRENGVTVHMQLRSDRQPLADVPAVYLVEPTTENIKQIVDDLSRHLYDEAYINFLRTIPRSLLEDFAAMVAEADVSQHIKQVYDQSLNFIVTEPNMFSLALPKAYHDLNSGGTSNASVESSMDSVVSGLYSVVITMKQIPIIRCPRGNAAEAISRKLEKKLRDFHMDSRHSKSYSSYSSYSDERPCKLSFIDMS